MPDTRMKDHERHSIDYKTKKQDARTYYYEVTADERAMVVVVGWVGGGRRGGCRNSNCSGSQCQS